MSTAVINNYTNNYLEEVEGPEEYLFSVDDTNNDVDKKPWHIPSLRTWEINENSTRYDNVLAAPSDDDLVKMWFGWASITGLVSLFTIMVLIPIVATKKTRNNPFNRYLIYLMIPDIIFSISCGVTCLVNAISEKYVAEWACKAQSFYFIFDVAANAWLNAAICYQLYQMLSSASRFQRYSPPTLNKVTMDACIVYLWAAFVGSWGLLDQSWWPHKTQLVIGAACIPIDFNTGSSIFFYTIFFPSLIGIPLGYVIYVAFQIWKHNMIPPTGKRRVLYIYFLRLAAAFIIMWLPALIFMYIINPWVGYWVMWFGGSWSHFQGGVSAALSLWKPDIAKTVYQFWTCQHGRSGTTTGGGQSEDFDLSSSFQPPPSSMLRRLVRRLSSSALLSSGQSQDQQQQQQQGEGTGAGGQVHISGLSLGSAEEGSSGGSSGGFFGKKSRRKLSSSSVQNLESIDESGSDILNKSTSQTVTTPELSRNSDGTRNGSSNTLQIPNNDNDMTIQEEEVVEEEEEDVEFNGLAYRIDMTGNSTRISSPSTPLEVSPPPPSSSITPSEPQGEPPV